MVIQQLVFALLTRHGVKRNDIVDFEDGKGTSAVIRHTPADISSGEAGKHMLHTMLT